MEVFSTVDPSLETVTLDVATLVTGPLPETPELVSREAARHGVRVLESEIVGLVPAAALLAAARWYLQLDAFTGDQVLEHRLRAAGSQA